MKKIILIIFLLLGIMYVLINHAIDNNNFKVIKKLIPHSIKYKIKLYISPNKIIEDKDKEIAKLKELNSQYFIFLSSTKSALKEELEVKKRLDNISFFFTKEHTLKLFDEKYIIKKYKNKNQINVGIFNYFPGSAYLEFYKDNLFLISPTGILSYSKNYNNVDQIELLQIKNNIKDFINFKQFVKKPYYSVKDIRISNEKIFISFTEEITEDCWSTSVIYAELNYKNVIFKKLFDQSEKCVNSEINENDFNGLNSGGRIEIFDDENIILTYGDYGLNISAQDLMSPFGKIFKININTKKFNIISYGHRNPQGLYYDKNKKILLSTEHGPQGGDEVNHIRTEFKDPINYGWPISSYGEHYGGPDGRNKHKYKELPLHKSHEKYGFYEPLTFFTPSIAISQITGLEDSKYLISSLKDNSLYSFKLNKKNKIEDLKRIYIGERIRDITFYKNRIYLFMEDSSSIAVIYKN